MLLDEAVEELERMALWANVTTNCIPCMHSTNDGVFSVLERWRSLGGSASASQPMTSRLLSPFLLLAAADLLFFFCGATSPGAAHGAALVASVSFLPVLPPLPSLWLALSPFFPSASMAPPLSSPCTLEPVGVSQCLRSYKEPRTRLLGNRRGMQGEI